ncbi:MAG: hypothetical protein M1490_01865 [Candidatus Bathyarchaeota archaeon]|nr:hypothetical protein [Candidatus Bathyarchaeota archaeon]
MSAANITAFPTIAAIKINEFLFIFNKNKVTPNMSEDTSKGVVSKLSATSLAIKIKKPVLIVAIHEFISLSISPKFLSKKQLTQSTLNILTKQSIESVYFLNQT